MLERDMESLIAQYPMEFFPRNEFKLIGRQGSFSGVGRYDLLFTDAHGSKILMELKARPAKYADADQLAKYKDALTAQGQRNVILWLVAPSISHTIREFLDNVGIEYSEIHVGEYERVAKQHGYALSSPPPEPGADTKPEREARVRSFRTRTTGSTYSSKLHSEFKRQLQKLGTLFPTARASFLDSIVQGDLDGFWLSTSKNAHLYYRDGYYCYIKLFSDYIILEKKFNGRIWASTEDNSALLFRRLPGLIADLGGSSDGWARGGSTTVTLTHRTPPEFFSRLLEVIAQEHEKSQQQRPAGED